MALRKKKIMIVTTGRADYGLLNPLIKKVVSSKFLEPQLIATGSHLSVQHGKTINLIEQDGFLDITDTVEMNIKNDSEHSICSAIANGLVGFSKLLQNKYTDLIVVLGDRYELLSACIAATIHKIPIAHIHGGETTLGLIDEPIRHSVTKMSAFHFPSLDLYAKRIIQMGEHPEKVHVVGALGIDNITDMTLMSSMELSEYTGINFEKKIALMTYHPVTLDSYEKAEIQIKEILSALLETDLFVLVTMPNTDTSSNVIYEHLKYYSKEYPEKFKLIKNLGQKGYLSAMKYSELMIGNSSSGIIESASFHLPVINIGDRQGARFKPKNIIDCICSKKEILLAINECLSDDFRKSIIDLDSPYGNGNSSTKILQIIESIDFNNKSAFLKKGFYDLKHDFSRIGLQLDT